MGGDEVEFESFARGGGITTVRGREVPVLGILQQHGHGDDVRRRPGLGLDLGLQHVDHTLRGVDGHVAVRVRREQARQKARAAADLQDVELLRRAAGTAAQGLELLDDGLGGLCARLVHERVLVPVGGFGVEALVAPTSGGGERGDGAGHGEDSRLGCGRADERDCSYISTNRVNFLDAFDFKLKPSSSHCFWISSTFVATMPSLGHLHLVWK